MKLKFLGHGGALSPIDDGNSNALLEINGSNLLIDFGITSNFVWRQEWKKSFADINALFITHLHLDHCCLETLFFWRYFLPNIDTATKQIVKPKLFAHPVVMEEIWAHLKPSMGVYANEVLHLTNFAECHSCSNFEFAGTHFTLIRNNHIKSSFASKDAYGLYFKAGDKSIYWSSDSSNINRKIINESNIVFHDCEYGYGKTGVHAHYSDLKKLPPDVKSKIYLMHYSVFPAPWKEDGFAGVIRKNDEFSF